MLQFDVTMARLKAEYGVEAVYEPVGFPVARWVYFDNGKNLRNYRRNISKGAHAFNGWN